MSLSLEYLGCLDFAWDICWSEVMSGAGGWVGVWIWEGAFGQFVGRGNGGKDVDGGGGGGGEEGQGGLVCGQ